MRIRSDITHAIHLKGKVTRWRVAVMAGIVLGIMGFLPGLHAPFQGDDYIYLVGNPALEEPVSGLWKFFVQRMNPWEYLPVRDLSYWLDHRLFGKDPTGYRVVNIVLYFITCLVFWYAARALMNLLARRRPEYSMEIREYVAAVATILYAAHPAHVESVVWIAGRKELLSGVFFFTALFLFLRGITGEKLNWKALLAGGAALFLALLSKATAMPFVLFAWLLLLIRFRAGETVIGRRGTILLPYLIPTLIMLVLHLVVAAGTRVLDSAGHLAGGWESISLPFLILGYLTRIALALIQPRLNYDVTEPGMPMAVAAVLALGMILGTVWAVRSLRRLPSPAGTGIPLFVLFSLPFLQIIPFATWSYASERFIFLPLAGMTLVFAGGMSGLRGWVRYALPGVLFVVLLVMRADYSSQWLTVESLITHNAQVAPHNEWAQRMYIQRVLLPQQRYAEAVDAAQRLPADALETEKLIRYIEVVRGHHENRLDDVQEHSRWFEGVVTRGDRDLYLLILAEYYERIGDTFSAIEYYTYANEVSYGFEDRRQVEGEIERLRSLHREALDVLAAMIAENPLDIRSRGELANLQMQLFLLDEAERNYKLLLQLASGQVVAHYNIGLTYARMGRDREAAEAMQRAVDRGFREGFVLNNLALAYQRAHQHQPAEAAFRRAIEADSTYWYAEYNLGMFYASLGRNDEARRCFENVLRKTEGADFIHSVLRNVQ